MIGNTLHIKLTGRHIKAFRKFGRRIGAYNTKECARLLVETLPEYQDDLRKVIQNTKRKHRSQAQN